MTSITFKQFIADYNNCYQTNYRIISTDTNNLPEIMFDLYDTDDFEVNYENNTIELY